MLDLDPYNPLSDNNILIKRLHSQVLKKEMKRSLGRATIKVHSPSLAPPRMKNRKT